MCVCVPVSACVCLCVCLYLFMCVRVCVYVFYMHSCFLMWFDGKYAYLCVVVLFSMVTLFVVVKWSFLQSLVGNDFS